MRVPLNHHALSDTKRAHTHLAKGRDAAETFCASRIRSRGTSPTPGMAGTNYQPLLDGLQNAADSYLNTLADSLRSKGVDVQTATPVGVPADNIVEYAHAHPGSLVVMSTHSRSGLANVVLGRVVLHGNTPMLVVPPPSQQ